ncbi:MAG: SEC-C domain-containing protein [Blastocatellia bacterium]
MTFAIVLGNTDQIIQVCDRRLTSNGAVVEDSASKVGHALCDDGAFLYCFTGLARRGSHTTSRWLLEAFYQAAQRDHTVRGIIEGFANQAAAYFQASQDLRQLSAQDRRLTVMASGYLTDHHIFNALITNFQDFDTYVDYPKAKPEFSYWSWKSDDTVSRNPTLIQAIGRFGALSEVDDVPRLRNMLERHAPAEALRNAAVALIRNIADRPQAGGTVGKKLNIGILPRSDLDGPVSGYESDELEKTMPMLDRVILRTDAPKILISDPRIVAEDPIIYPKVHRNARCPCGSGKRYRECHMKRKRV